MLPSDESHLVRDAMMRVECLVHSAALHGVAWPKALSSDSTLLFADFGLC